MTEKTITNLRGPAARIVGASAVSVPSDTPVSVVPTGPDQNRHFDFFIPEGRQGLPGVNAVPADEAVGAYVEDEGSFSGTATRNVAAAMIADRVGGVTPSPLAGAEISTSSGTPRVLDLWGGKLWGVVGTTLYSRPEAGGAWEIVPGGTISGYPLRLVSAGGGEVLLLTNTELLRSSGWGTGSITWSVLVTANGVSYFMPWGFDGDGQRFIVTSYASPGAYADSRYAWVSTDGGATFAVVYDAVTRYGATQAELSHMHAACYDPWSGRFYLAEGHSDQGGIYYSADDGLTWTRAPGMVANPAPTVIVATDSGLVCGSDSINGGLYGVVRQVNPALESIAQTWRWVTPRDGLIGYGWRGFRDPTTGIVYIAFRSNFSEVKPIIAAGTAVSGAKVFTWESGGLADHRVSSIVVTNRGEIVAYAESVSSLAHIRARTSPAGGSAQIDTGNVSGGAADGTSTAVGPTAAAGLRSVAVGVKALASVAGNDAVAIGFEATAGSIGVGVGRGAKGLGVAIGNLADSNATGVAVGVSAIARDGAVAAGNGSEASGFRSVALGRNAKATVADGTALGEGAVVTHASSVAIGRGAATTTQNQVAFGPRHMEFGVVAGPAAPAANTARIYFDTSGGKMRAMIRYPTGAAQQFSIEP